MLWTEKYRPRKITDIVGNETAKSQVMAYLQNTDLFPQLFIFVGEPGTGKTSMANAIAHELYGDNNMFNFKEYNASDERGIDFVRNKIKEMVSAGVYGDVSFRLIFLDEADYLTPEAQATLRSMIEKYSNNAKFIFSINYPHKIIKPLFSRATVIQFKKPSMSELIEYINTIAEREGFVVDEDASREIISDCDYIPRDVLIKLQSCYVMMTYNNTDRLTLDYVRSTTYPDVSRSALKPIIQGIKHRNVGKALSETMALIEGGIDPISILKMLTDSVVESPRITNKDEVFKVIAKVDKFINSGATPKIQFAYLYATIIKNYST